MPANAIARLESIQVTMRPVGMVIADFSLHVGCGEVVALTGSNGRGKTSVLRVASGLTRPKRGSVSILGVDLLASPRAACAGLYSVIDLQSSYDFLTLRQYAEVHRATYGNWSESEALEFCRATDVPLDQPISTFSRGQKLKARLACAFASGTSFLALDEPFESLDSKGRHYLRDRMTEWKSTGRRGILFSAHREEDTDDLATRIVEI